MAHSRTHTTTVTQAPPDGARGAPHEDLGGARADGGAQIDTLPGPQAARVEDDPDFQHLAAHVDDARAFLRGRGWDNLAHIERFAVACALASRVVERYGDDATRRRVVALVWPLLPEPARTAGAGERSRPLAPPALPAAVDERAHALFMFQPGDVPRIAPAYSAFLAALDVDQLFAPPASPDAPAVPFLAPRSVCPGAARGAGTAVFLEERTAASNGTTLPTSVPPSALSAGATATLVPGAGGVTWRCVVSRAALGDDGDDVRVRVGPDGQPMRTVDGREQPITVTSDVLAAWLLSAGPDARGLDLRSEDDRALLLAWAFALRDVHVEDRGTGTKKSAFAWLEDERTPLDVRVRVVEAAVRCAIAVVARGAVDPLAARITLRPARGDGGWTERAGAALDACALFHDVTPRSSLRSSPGSEGARDVVWLDALLRPGYAGGRLSPLAAGRAFARLATSVLAPLGVLPSSGLKDGSGAVLLQRLVERPAAHAPGAEGARHVERAPPRLVSFDGAGGFVDEPLFAADPPDEGAGAADVRRGAWRNGRGLALPDPKGAPRHDVTAMPAWVAFFLEGLS